MGGSSLVAVALAGALTLAGSGAALAAPVAIGAPVAASTEEDRPVVGSAGCDAAVNEDPDVRQTQTTLDRLVRFASVIPPGVIEQTLLLLELQRREATERLCAPPLLGAPTTGAAATVKGGGTLAVGGQRILIAVDAKTSTTGTATGRFAVSGGGAATTAGSRTLTSATKTPTGATVSGTAVTATGSPVSFTLTVADRPRGRDQITARIGGKTLSGTLTTGNITTS